MKRFTLLILVIFGLSSLNSLTIVKKDPPSQPKGSQYFPLFVGEKWVYSVSQFDATFDLTWEIISYNEITDTDKNIVKIPSFEVTSKETTEKWYFVEYDGFICSLEISDKDYKITRVFPLNPQLEDKWISNKENYMITDIQESFARADFENETLNQYGYQNYSKNIGMKELFQSTKGVKDNSGMSFKLKEYVSFEDVKDKLVTENKSDSNFTEKKEYTEEKFIEKEKPDYKYAETKNDAEDSFIKCLNYDKSYVQVGAFKSLKNAQTILIQIKRSGYKAYIFHENNEFYKIVLEVTGNDKKFLTKVKKEIDKKAFIKQSKR